MIRTKIICTLGPAVDDPKVMRQLIDGGMDVARMNFSHGSHEEHGTRLKKFRKLCREAEAYIPVLMDTRGPEIRIGEFRQDAVSLKEGQQYTLTTEAVEGDAARCSVSYAGLAQDVSAGDHILVDDGLVAMAVQSVSGNDILCRVLNDGVISSKKSVNVPGVSLHLPALTQQDKQDILFAVNNQYDFIAVSFVRKKDDVAEILKLLEEHGGDNIKVIAKIENREGYDNLDEILRIADGIMVARGDLGVEIPVEEIPVVQKDMIRRCYRAGKPVITATQMLDSMIRNPRPTRAEVTDVANAIYDGTSAIMLSGETASGKYPLEALETMRRIAETTEQSIPYWRRFLSQEADGDAVSITNAISHATCTTAMDLNAAAIVAVTTSGETARRISRFRPACPIIAATTEKHALHQLRLSWGVYPYLVDVVGSTDDLFDTALETALCSGLVHDGDLIVVTSGVPVGMSGTTNMLKVQMVGNILCRGKGIGENKATGTLRVIPRGGSMTKHITRGDILVIDEITDALLPVIRKAAALILDGEDKAGKAATLSMALEIPVITGAIGALNLLKDGTVVSVDAHLGTVQATG